MTEFPTVRAVRFALDGAPVKVFSSAGIVLDHPVGRSAYAALSSIAPPLAGAWRSLPAAPVAGLATPVSVWTGKRMLVFGGARRDVVAAYDPSTNAWQRLPTPLKPIGSPSAVWTGKEILIWGRGVAEAFHPGTKRWRLLPRPPFAGAPAVVAWTGGELLGLNADLSGGAAYSPASNAWRKLAPSPLAGSRQAAGAWTGRELLVLGAGTRAAAYDRTTDTWRSLAPLPALRDGANAVWDGRELLVVGGSASRAGRLPAEGFAYDLATNRWRPLPPMESGRLRAAAVWTGKRLLLWGGGTGGAGSLVIPPHGLAYDPRTDRWSPLPQAPLLGRLDPTAVWTGRALIVWGGETRAARRLFADGAAFRPAKP
jgi:hypothetical protein